MVHILCSAFVALTGHNFLGTNQTSSSPGQNYPKLVPGLNSQPTYQSSLPQTYFDKSKQSASHINNSGVQQDIHYCIYDALKVLYPIHTAPQSKMPFAYIPKSLANTSRSAHITDIYICADEPNAVSGPPELGSTISGPMTNHWVMYFVTSSTESFCFDPSPSGPGNTLDLIVSNKSYADIFSAVKLVRLTPLKGLTIGHVLDHIADSKYDNYTFSPEGQGCRFWIYSVVASMHSAGYIVGDSEVNASTEALEVVWTIRGDPAPVSQQTGIAKGTF